MASIDAKKEFTDNKVYSLNRSSHLTGTELSRSNKTVRPSLPNHEISKRIDNLIVMNSSRCDSDFD